MTRAKLILVGCFLLVLLAGMSLGVLVGPSWLKCEVSRPETNRPPRAPRSPNRSWLVQELNLTTTQSDQMAKILSEAQLTARQVETRKRAAASQRDQEIRTLLSDTQRVEYDAIRQNFTRQSEELSQEEKRAFDEAIARTKTEVLTPEQAAKYDKLMQMHREGQRGRGGGMQPGRRGGMQGGPRGESRRRDGGPTTSPAAE